MKQKSIFSLLNVLIMLTIGMIVGMLFSPTTGVNIRSVLLYKLEGLLKKIKLSVFQLLAIPSQKKVHNNGKIASQEIINQTISKAKKLLEEVEALSDNLEMSS